VLFLQRQRKAIDDAAQDLQQLGNAIVVFRLKDEAIEHIVDGLAHKRSVHHELAINPSRTNMGTCRAPQSNLSATEDAAAACALSSSKEPSIVQAACSAPAEAQLCA